MGVLDIEGAIISSEFCEMEVLDIGGAIIFPESGVLNHINNEEFDG